MQIATSLIDDTIPDICQVPVPPAADLELARTVRRHGILQPLILRQAGNRYQVVLGRRRLRAAIAAELAEVPAEVREMTDAEARTAQLVENLHRRRMHPIDIWRNAQAMLTAGIELAEVALALGLDDRSTKRMARLGQLHPEILKAIEQEGELPDDRELRVIANAPAKTQALALKNARCGGTDGGVRWHQLERLCRRDTIPRSLAIFDLDKAKIVWDEDLFAEPGSDDQFTTANIEQFLKLQRAALEAQVAAEQKKKKRVRLAEFDAHRKLVLPKGWREAFGGNIDKPKAHEHVFLAVGADGQIVKHLVLDAPSQKLAEKKAADAAKAKQKAATPAASDAAGSSASDADPDTIDRRIAAENPDAEDVAAEPIEAIGRGPLTKAGLAIVAAAKTEALRQALAEDMADPVEMLALTVLAFTATNVQISGLYRHAHRDHPHDMIATLLLPGGDLPERLDAKVVCGVASELLARFLIVGGPDAGRSSYNPASGDAAEWIGRALGADRLLPRFDTEAFLAHIAGSELKRVAGDLNMRTSMKVDALRSALIGNAPNYRPAAAQFGAAAPVLRRGATLDGHEWREMPHG